MHTTAVASDPLDLLALVPELVGFEPRNSLVLVSLSGTRTSGTFRVDLPAESLSSKETRHVASTLAGMVGRLPDVDGLFAIVYTDDLVSDSAVRGRGPRAELVSRLREAARAIRLVVRGAYFVSPDAWGDYCGDPRSRDELDEALELRRLDPDARPVRRSPEEEAELPVADEDERERTRRALASLRRDPTVPDPVWFARYSSGWTPDEIGATTAALIADILGEPSARDIVLFTWGWGEAVGEEALRFEDRFHRGEAVADDPMALALAGVGLERPHVPSVVQAIAMLRQTAARLDGPDLAPVLASLGWLNWAIGRGSVAGEYVRRARAADFRYGFAELLEKILGQGLLPEWAFDGATPAEDAQRRPA